MAFAGLAGCGLPAVVVLVSGLGGAWGDGGEDAPGGVIVVYSSVKRTVCVTGLFSWLGESVYEV